ncbi:hypothetical protein [Marinobacter salarius]|uniref:hypothetical protein n=1 Tax=Marinobacter salarius TaxID=1420917 RepID=UPI00242010C0|nr:hypothetical protein [Marinobacter salarius]
MSLNEICRLYRKGQKLRRQAKELSNASLARKFECSERTIAKIANRMPVSVPEDEQRIIRACISERDRMKSEAAELSMHRLGKQYGLSKSSIASHLEYLAEREVAA